MEEIKWNDRFNLGVDFIDQAHQNLFSIVNKLVALNEEADKQPYACREGIKYFKSYTLKHFAEEEAYMQEIDYKGYKKHKRIHEKMCNKTLPELEQEMETENFSEESVQHFMGICIGWLNTHIMVEDRAIAQKSESNLVYNVPGDEVATLEKAIGQVMKKLFQIDAKLVSAHYVGENFYPGFKLCYRISYRTAAGTLLQVFFIYEDRQMLKQIGDILGRPLTKVDKTTLYAVKVISEKFMNEIKTYFPVTDGYHREKTEVISFEQFARMFRLEDLGYSLLFRTGNYEHFAFCIRL